MINTSISFLSLAGAATSIIFVAASLLLSRQNFFGDKHNFVTTKVLSQQAYFCRDKRVFFFFVATKHIFCRDKSMLVASQFLSFLSLKNISLSRKHTFVATKTTKHLSRQKWYLWQLSPMIPVRTTVLRPDMTFAIARASNLEDHRVNESQSVSCARATVWLWHSCGLSFTLLLQALSDAGREKIRT